MNVWKYIYQVLQDTPQGNRKRRADDFAAMLFVAFLDMFLYFGILILIDRLVDNVLSTKYEPFFFALYILGTLTIG